MAQKRSPVEAELQPLAIRSTENKRTKMSPSFELRSNSSEETAVLEAPALQSSPEPSPNSETDQSSVSSEPSSDSEDEDEEDESEQESEDEESDEDTNDLSERTVRPGQDRVTLGGPAKPHIDPARVMEEAQKLYTKLQEFLPMMREANADLLKKGDDANMERVKDGERHIEMDLGLGVLEEQKEEAALKEAGSEEDSEDDGGEGEESTDAMRELLGAKIKGVRPSIEEVQVANMKSEEHGGSDGRNT